MKKYFIPAVLAAILAGCTANDPSVDTGRNGVTDAEVKGYLSINLVSTGAPRTRDDDALNGTQNGSYQYGTSDENYVNEVRFYFFYSDDETGETGLPCPIRKNPLYEAPENPDESTPSDNPLMGANGQIEYFSYYDWSPTYAENQNTQGEPGETLEETDGTGSLSGATVEKVLTAMVVLTSKQGYAPSQVVAIINPTPEIKALQNPTLTKLQEQVANYLDGLTSKNFVMSNTSQIGKTETTNILEVVIAQDIKEDCLATTQPEAQENPLVVYVERVVARLDQTFAPVLNDKDGNPVPDNPPLTLNQGTENEYTIYPTGFLFTSQDVDYTEDGSQGDDQERESYTNEPIYVKFYGWAVTSTPNRSNLIKNIDANWGDADDLFGTINEPWFITEYHRTFWGKNPADLTDDPAKPDESYIWFNYNELIGEEEPDQGECFNMDVTQTYMQENANPYIDEARNPLHPTKVIYAGQLCDKNGNEVTVAEWNGVYFTLQGLKELAASMLQMYYNANENDPNAAPDYKPIQPDQITFITRREYQNSNTAIFSEPGSYYVYPVLTSSQDANQDNAMDNAAGLTWYHHANDGSDDPYTVIKPENLKSYMYDTFGVSKIWNNGMTYYYYDINHLGAENSPGYWGVVRNHIYNVKIKALTGLGTPVWDETEDIYPERPNPEGNNISAEVKVLMWRMVSQDVEFDW